MNETMSQINLWKKYPVDELNKINFWNLVEPVGTSLEYRYNQHNKYILFKPMDLTPNKTNNTFVRKINYLKRAVLRTKIIFDILDTTPLYLTEIKRYISSFIGTEAHCKNYINSYGWIKGNLDDSNYFQISNNTMAYLLDEEERYF